MFNASKTQFLHLSTRHNLPNNYPLFFNDTQLSPSSTLNILGVSFTQSLNWKFHISSLAKTASMKLGVLNRLRQFFSPQQLLSVYKGLVRPCMEYASHVWGGSTHTALLNRVESKAFRLINSPPLTDCLQSVSLRRDVGSLAVFYRYFHSDCSSELANCMPPPSGGPAAPDFLLILIPILSNSLMQESTSIFILSFLLLVDSGTLYLNLYFLLSTTYLPSKDEYQATSRDDFRTLLLNLAFFFFFYWHSFIGP